MEEIYIKDRNNDFACSLYILFSKTAIEILWSNKKFECETVTLLILCNHYEKAQQVDLLKQLWSPKEQDSNHLGHLFL